MLGFSVGKVFFDALILCGLLYLIARHDADIDVQKMAMVVAGTALGNILLYVMISDRLPPGVVVWVMPLIEVLFSAFMIMTFCWVSFWKSLLVAVLFGCLHVGFGLFVNYGLRKAMGGSQAAPTLMERQERDLQEAKDEMERMFKAQQIAMQAQLGAATGAVPVAVGAATNVAGTATNGAVASATGIVAGAATAATNLPVPPAVDWEAARKRVRIGGVSGRPGAYVALVNQRVVETGGVVSVSYEGRTYRWTVAEITRGNVRMEPRDVQ